MLAEREEHAPPRCSGEVWSVVIFLRILRMILPERVFGRPGAQWMWSGVAMGPNTFRTWNISSCLSLGE